MISSIEEESSMAAEGSRFMSWRWRSSSLCAVTGLARGDERTAELPQVDRFKPMRLIVEELKLEVNTALGRKPVEAIDEPIYIFDDPTRRLSDGAVWAWGRTGRPAAFLSLSMKQTRDGSQFWLCEATSLASGCPSQPRLPPTVLSGIPKRLGLTLRPIPKAAAPGNDETKRLRQMKELSRRFRAFEYYPPEDAKEDEPLMSCGSFRSRCFRYSDPASGLTDSARSSSWFTAGTRKWPSLIEAHGGRQSEPSWSYAARPTRRGEAARISR